MRKIRLALLTTGIVLIACQKEFSIVHKRGKDVLESFELKQPLPQKFTIHTANAGWIDGAQGTRISFPANAFITQSDQPVTGNVTIELKEIYSVADMILNNKPTQTGFTPIESGGVFYLNAMQNKQQLKLAPGVILTANLPTKNLLPDMQVFNGNLKDTMGASYFSWTLNTDTAANNVTVERDSLWLDNYLMSIDGMDWINCDRFLTDSIYLTKVRISNPVSDERSGVVIHFTGRKSIIRLSQKDDYFFGAVPEIAATIIAISDRNGQLYAGFKPVQLKKDQSYSVALEPISEEVSHQRLLQLK